MNRGFSWTKYFCVKLSIFSYAYALADVLGAQKNRLIETVLLSTHNIWFGWEIKKIFFCYTPLTRVLMNRGSFMTAHVLLNLLNELKKGDKMHGLLSFFIAFSQQV